MARAKKQTQNREIIGNEPKTEKRRDEG